LPDHVQLERWEALAFAAMVEFAAAEQPVEESL
jgi:hypothetical protein